MPGDAWNHKKIKAGVVLFDNWHAIVATLMFIHRADRVFFTTVKSNRCLKIHCEKPPPGKAVWLKPEQLDWTGENMQTGILVHMKGLTFPVRLFKIVATYGDIEWVVTNSPDSELKAGEVGKTNVMRRRIEELHRDVKQLVGTEKCQCRKARSQRNHLALGYHAWMAIKAKAKELGKTLSGLKTDIWRDFLKEILFNPPIPALSRNDNNHSFYR